MPQPRPVPPSRCAPPPGGGEGGVAQPILQHAGDDVVAAGRLQLPVVHVEPAQAVRTGVDPSGHELNSQMSWRNIGRMDDDELTAVYEYLVSRP
jgi:hypothetical protein